MQPFLQNLILGSPGMDLAHHSFSIRTVSACGCKAAGFAPFYRGSDLWISESAKYFGCNSLCVAISLDLGHVLLGWTLLPRQSQIIQVSEVLSIQLPPLQSVSQTKTPASGKKISCRCLGYALYIHLYTFTAWFLTDLYLDFLKDIFCWFSLASCSLASKLCSPAALVATRAASLDVVGWYSSVLQRCGLGDAGLDIVLVLTRRDVM